MAKQIKLSAQTRTHAGRTAVKKIKAQGFVPAVIYGGTEGALNLQLASREIFKVLSHATGEHLLVDLEIADGAQVTNRLALIQEVQHHAVKRTILHVDFHAVDPNKKLHAAVTIETLGESVGVKNGGILELNLHSIEVECLPLDLPEAIVIDVSALEIDQAIHIKDLVLPAGVTARGNGDLTVMHVVAPKVEIAAAVDPSAKPDGKQKKSGKK